jgi:hypothetical protein
MPDLVDFQAQVRANWKLFMRAVARPDHADAE